MQCEICGKFIDRGKRIRLEGSVVVACSDCSSYGELVISEVAPYKAPKKKRVQEKEKFELKQEYTLIEGYAEMMREKREHLGLKQEDLAKKINQPKSLIHRIESHRFHPKGKLARKIEHTLGIKILEKVEEGQNPKQEPLLSDEEVTLGDMVVIKKKKNKE